MSDSHSKDIKGYEAKLRYKKEEVKTSKKKELNNKNILLFL